jgi:hypothetical protein
MDFRVNTAALLGKAKGLFVAFYGMKISKTCHSPEISYSVGPLVILGLIF